MKKTNWKSAWVVGGSTGLGAALSKRLALEETRLFISSRNTPALRRTCHKISNATPIPLDVTDHIACGLTAGLIQHKLGTFPDLIILNAAIYTPMKSYDYDPKDIFDMMNVNFMGVVNMIKAIASQKNDDHNVTIAVISSPSGWRGLPGGGGYGASKAAVTNFVESMKLDLEEKNIHLRLITPGFIKTRLTDKNDFDMPQLMEADYAAEKILKGLKKNGFDITFPNPFVFMLKILRILPYSVYFWFMRKKRLSK
ncbi:SDR family NAD(P)-dependent oxidoreductase [Pseudemcibacter aquimaris]|uniref:SDR family NAD(P)-dependent oxidoreductase n=1 Tax=Pseudemcibacter aquimaris TaxID=2857064 RepID=UPI00201347E7|nr:SDR family NAD(P)-dependent oxidoreductase [Pseudemcibacter aquimaris]MCC3861178.1 SDR family NAD(P)-dependent oxidoreductase [Pseudemcibacter aquimaris]WDU57953.1 SDR family NAD(P)-dependent oxidoreductase [Pseudemcibacter aquimaris]